MSWRPGKVWTLLGFGCVIIAVADAVSAVQEARGAVSAGNGYTFIWTTGAVLIAYAAWMPPAPTRQAPQEMVGLRAVALPLAVQLLAALIQIREAKQAFADGGDGDFVERPEGLDGHALRCP